MKQRLTSCSFLFEGFQRAPMPGEFGITHNVVSTTVISFLNNIRTFYNYCLELEKQLDRSDIRVNIAFAQFDTPVNAYIRKVQIKFNKLEKVYKEKYKRRTGLKIARGFYDSPEGKEFLRKKQKAFSDAIKNPSKKFASEIEKATEGDKPNDKKRNEIEQKTGFKSITFLAFDEIFYNVLSYGDKNIKKIQSDILSGKNKGVYVIELSESNF